MAQNVTKRSREISLCGNKRNWIRRQWNIKAFILFFMSYELFMDSCLPEFHPNFLFTSVSINFGDIYIPHSLCYYVFSNSLIAVLLALNVHTFAIQTRARVYEAKCFSSITSVIDFLILLLISSINRLENSMLKGWMSKVTRREFWNIWHRFSVHKWSHLFDCSIIRITRKQFNFFVLLRFLNSEGCLGNIGNWLQLLTYMWLASIESGS